VILPKNADCVCAEPFDAMCDAELADPTGQHIYKCTREKDHTGDHVACGFTVHQGTKWSTPTDGESRYTLTCVRCAGQVTTVFFHMCFNCYHETFEREV
jgi:hypothetical protein